jgi:diguanylate cyclase (GGDEF)-like protein/PAS domain S-box-containing protein
VRVNPAFTAITGYTPRDVLGQTPKILSSGRHGPEFYSVMWQALLEKGRWQGEIWNRRKNGETFIEWLSITRIEGGDEHGGFAATFTDITKRKEAEELMEHKAHHDALTDLPNRLLFRDRLHSALSIARRYQRQTGLLYIDLDLFKHVNDTLGHAAGDALLIEAAHRLTAAIRDSDTVARLGGDEFAVVLPEINGPLEAEEVAQRIVQSMRQPFHLKEGTGQISASIGMAVFPDHGADAETLQKHADMALYAVKKGGRNAYRAYSPLMANP